MDELTVQDIATQLTPRESDERPTPDNFIQFLPWACAQMQLDVSIVITKVTSAYGNEKKNRNIPVEKPKTDETSVIIDVLQPNNSLAIPQYKIIKMTAIYDTADNLILLKFEKNWEIPRLVFKIIGLVIPYQPRLTNLTISKRIDNVSLYEIEKLTAYITEICLDDSYFAGASYDLLLENASNLTNLSLRRCKIDDEMIQKIAKKLVHPLPASKTLLLLNFSSNRITDEGARCIAEALKTNRQLVYLNLADNAISDDGSVPILEVLTDFKLSSDEIKASRQRYFKHLKNNRNKSETLDIKDSRKSKRKLGKKPSSTFKNSKSVENANFLEEFNDPYSIENIYTKEGVVFCIGNNRLAYFNLSYNNISYFTVRKLLKVLENQKTRNRKPRGLVNVLLEGNNLPINCIEFKLIDQILNKTASKISSTKKNLKKP